MDLTWVERRDRIESRSGGNGASAAEPAWGEVDLGERLREATDVAVAAEQVSRVGK